MVGWYSDRTNTPLGRRVPFILWSCIFVALGLSGLGFISNYSSLFILWLFIQANASIGYGPFHALIRDLVPGSHIGVASSLKILADGAGGVTLVAVSGALIGRFTGPQTVHWLWFTLGIIAATLVSGAVISSLTVISRERAARISYGRPLDSLRSRVGLHPHLPWFLISRYLMITAIFVFPTYGLFFLRDVVGATNPPQTLGLMILSIGGALVLSIYPAGWLSDRIGRKPVVIIGGLAAAIGTLALLTADTPLGVVIIASIVGAMIGTVLSASWALANELGAKGREGQHMGIVDLATIAGAASAKVFGPGVDLLNLASPGYGYSALLAGSGVAFLISSLLIVPLDASAHQSQTPEESTVG
jgi:MFS family permease